MCTAILLRCEIKIQKIHLTAILWNATWNSIYCVYCHAQNIHYPSALTSLHALPRPLREVRVCVCVCLPALSTSPENYRKRSGKQYLPTFLFALALRAFSFRHLFVKVKHFADSDNTSRFTFRQKKRKTNGEKRMMGQSSWWDENQILFAL